MKHLSKTVAILFLGLFLSSCGSTEESDPKVFFSSFMKRSEQMKNFIPKFTKIGDAKKIFKDDEFAKKYTDLIEEHMSKTPPSSKSSEEFVDIRIDTFTTEDIVNGKGNYAGGMNKVVQYLKPNITFYKVNYLRTEGAQYGVAFKYFCYLDGKWVYFPKPWKAVNS